MNALYEMCIRDRKLHIPKDCSDNTLYSSSVNFTMFYRKLFLPIPCELVDFFWTFFTASVCLFFLMESVYLAHHFLPRHFSHEGVTPELLTDNVSSAGDPKENDWMGQVQLYHHVHQKETWAQHNSCLLYTSRCV